MLANELATMVYPGVILLAGIGSVLVMRHAGGGRARKGNTFLIRPFLSRMHPEEVSGLPTLCRPIREGGLGFHYRLGMAMVSTNTVGYAEPMKHLSPAQCNT